MICDSCNDAATEVLYAMCVHEHYRERPKCSRHADVIMDFSERHKLVCEPCFHGTEPHTCIIGALSKPSAASQ